ncbi:MAG TPA: hypothetical protein H9830_15255, partial [Candidatus Agrococcus pullicola]|nr:hypothetical protein [Candidatus Agrococcus pullicola]
MRALWSAGWASAVTAYFTVGATEPPMMVGIMLAAVFLGCVLGRLLRRRDALIGGWSSAMALAVIAVLVWIGAFDSLAFMSTIAAVIATAGFVLGAPARSPEAPTRAGRILTPILRGVALAVVMMSAGVAASVHVVWALTLSALLTLGWAISSLRIPAVRTNGKRAGVDPVELLQGVTIAAALGGWAALLIVILPTVGPSAPWPAVNHEAITIGLMGALGMIGAGLGFGLVRPLVESGAHPRSVWLLGPLAAGMLLLMVTRPGSFAAAGFVAVLIVSALTAAAFRMTVARTPTLAADDTI